MIDRPAFEILLLYIMTYCSSLFVNVKNRALSRIRVSNFSISVSMVLGLATGGRAIPEYGQKWQSIHLTLRSTAKLIELIHINKPPLAPHRLLPCEPIDRLVDCSSQLFTPIRPDFIQAPRRVAFLILIVIDSVELPLWGNCHAIVCNQFTFGYIQCKTQLTTLTG